MKSTRTSKGALVAGRTVVLHVRPTNEGESIGVAIGGIYLLRYTGYELLSVAGGVELR